MPGLSFSRRRTYEPQVYTEEYFKITALVRTDDTIAKIIFILSIFKQYVCGYVGKRSNGGLNLGSRPNDYDRNSKRATILMFT